MIALMASLLLCANKRSYQNKNMQQRHLNRETYFKEQVNTAQEFYMDYIKKYVLLQKGIKVLEIGCGEGGNLLPFAQLGCEITGIDITPSRIEQAQQFFKAANYEGTFIATDFLKARAEDYGTFQLILIHDVIEHIEPKEQFIKHIKAFADKDTLIFWGFPAWQMPFGGHQQICKNKIVSHLPFVHLLPAPVYRSLLDVCGIPSRELLEIKQCKVTIESFEKMMKANQHQIVNRKLWLINPHYKQKFGLQPQVLPLWLAHLRYIRNFFSTACFYLTRITS